MVNQIHVLAVLIRAEGGGAESSVQRMVKPLADLDIHLSRVVCNAPKASEAPHDLRVLTTGSSRSIKSLLAAARNLSDAIHELKPDIVHLHCERPELVYVLARLISPSCATPLVFTEHTTNPYQHQKLVGFVVRTLLAKWNATKVTCFETGLPKVHSIYNPVALENLQPLERTLTRSNKLVYIGRLIALKRVDVVLKAMHEAKFRGGLLVIGDGPERTRLDQLAIKLGLENVEFIGYQSNPWSFVTSRDVLVSASRREGEPLTVVEAICRRVPMLLSDIPAHRSLAENPETIFTDVAGLSRKLSKLSEVATELTPSTEWATSVSFARTPSTVALKWRAIYELVLGESSEPNR